MTYLYKKGTSNICHYIKPKLTFASFKMTPSHYSGSMAKSRNTSSSFWRYVTQAVRTIKLRETDSQEVEHDVTENNIDMPHYGKHMTPKYQRHFTSRNQRPWNWYSLSRQTSWDRDDTRSHLCNFVYLEGKANFTAVICPLTNFCARTEPEATNL